MLSGHGKSFSAGADLSWMKEQAQLDETENEESAAHMAGAFLRIARCVKPKTVSSA